MTRPHRSDFWERWEDHLSTGDDTNALVAGASDEDLLAILTSRATPESGHDREVIEAELLLRLEKRRMDIPSGSLEVLLASRNAYTTAIRGQLPMRAAESILQAGDKTALGRTVSATAAANVATTKLTYESAQEHAAKAHASMAQSRVSETLADDAVVTTTAGAATTQDLGARMRASGHEKEGRAADDAARETQDAAQHAAALARRNRQHEEGRDPPSDA